MGVVFCHLQVLLSYNCFRNDPCICDSNQRKSCTDAKELWWGVPTHVYADVCTCTQLYVFVCAHNTELSSLSNSEDHLGPL